MIATKQTVYDCRGAAGNRITPNIIVNSGERVYIIVNTFTNEGTITWTGHVDDATLIVCVEPTQSDEANIAQSGYMGPEGVKGFKIPFKVSPFSTCIIDPSGIVSKVELQETNYSNTGHKLLYLSPTMSNMNNLVAFGYNAEGHAVETNLYLNHLNYRYISRNDKVKYVVWNSNTPHPPTIPLMSDRDTIVVGGSVYDGVLLEEGVYITNDRLGILYGGDRFDAISGNGFTSNAIDIVVAFPNRRRTDNVWGVYVSPDVSWKAIDVVGSNTNYESETMKIYDARSVKSELIVVYRDAINMDGSRFAVMQVKGPTSESRIPIALSHGVGKDIHPMGVLKAMGMYGRGVVFVGCLACGDNLYVHDSTMENRVGENGNDLVFDEIVLTPAADLFIKNSIKGFSQNLNNVATRFSGVLDLRRRSWYEVYCLSKKYINSSVYEDILALEPQWRS